MKNWFRPKFTLRVKKLHPSAKLPVRALNLDNGYDLFLSGLDEVDPKDLQGAHVIWEDGKRVGVAIRPGGFAKLPLGISTAFDPSYGGFIFDKSSVGNNGLKYLGGVIEGTYRGPWAVMLANIKTYSAIVGTYPRNTIELRVGQKICQVVFLPLIRPEVVEVDELDETERKGGFGSTGSM